jgi:hypothetical protein
MYVSVGGNVARIVSPPETAIRVIAKTNSPLAQQVTITDGNEVNITYTGSGQNNTIIGQSTFSTRGDSILTAMFTYQPTGNQGWLNSGLKSGGPYTIGNYNILAIVAENGDDADYNDCILEFSWRT